MLVKITIPISNYEDTGVFEKEIYLECDKVSPSKEKVLSILDDLIETEDNLVDEAKFIYSDELAEAYEVVDFVNEYDWPVVGDGVVEASKIINHPNWGQQSITVKIIEPIKVN